jgi:hypothetical protein
MKCFNRGYLNRVTLPEYINSVGYVPHIAEVFSRSFQSRLLSSAVPFTFPHSYYSQAPRTFPGNAPGASY